MNLNVADWKSFYIGRLFTMLNGKGITQEEIADNQGDFIAVQSGEENNGVMGKINLNYCKQMKYTYTEKSCLTVARSGSAGFVSYQHDGCVVGDSAKVLLLLNEDATTEHYLFMQAMLTANRFKYTYGRKVTEDKYLNDVVDLPVQHNADGSIFIDDTKKYSDEGYVPDWQFMENYIKSLHHKPLTTKNKSGQAPALNVQDWGEFRVGDLFDITRGQRLIADDREQGKLSYFSASQENNGCTDYISNPLFVDKDALIYDTFGDCYYVSGQFTASDEISILHNANMTEKSGLFIATIMSANKYKYAFGRKAFQNKFVDNIIKLPIDTNGEPDWQFMEDYIKALPYGDRLEG